MMVRVALVLLVSFVVVSCTEPVVHDTASGKPEVMIATHNGQAVRSALISEMINGGYNVSKESESLVAFDRPVDNALAAALLGSRYDSTPNTRISYTIVQMQNAIRVVAEIAVITNPGSAFEQHTNMNANPDSRGVQALLDRVKSHVESR